MSQNDVGAQNNDQTIDNSETSEVSNQKDENVGSSHQVIHKRWKTPHLCLKDKYKGELKSVGWETLYRRKTKNFVLRHNQFR